MIICVAAFQNPLFENKLSTDSMTIDEMVQAIAKVSGLELLPSPSNRLLKWLKRKKIQFKHIRKL